MGIEALVAPASGRCAPATPGHLRSLVYDPRRLVGEARQVAARDQIKIGRNTEPLAKTFARGAG